MLTMQQVEAARARAAAMLEEAGVVTTPEERAAMEIVDEDLNHFDQEGLAIITYVNTDRYCAKEIVMFPGQTCPQHRHPAVHGRPGKMETFRCRWGEVYLYIPGEPAAAPLARVPEGSEAYYTVFAETVLRPGDQFTIPSDTWHWFQAGPHGAVVSEFSSTSDDESDVFTDPRIKRIPIIVDADDGG